jgi:hypothetical protein
MDFDDDYLIYYSVDGGNSRFYLVKAERMTNILITMYPEKMM